MELKLAYRILRKISDWAIAGYYSDLTVQGSENVPKNGPVIIVSSHHNEIFDIAIVAATIPYRRHVSFWTKSTLFEHPFGGPIVSSAGAIPVQRNPDRAVTNGSTSNSSQAELFKSTSLALANGQVVGVYPEGTSYTQPSIVQVMSGAGWAAVEFIKYKPEQDLVIVPLGIVYSDKANFQSRVFARYGKPISMSAYKADLFAAPDIDQASRTTVKKVMEEIEKSLFELTINAKDWETLYSANTARDILWRDPDKISAEDWVPVSQKLVDIFTSPESTATKTALTKYFALLHHTGLTHASIEYLIPSTAYNDSRFSLLRTLLVPSFSTILNFPISLLQTLLFIPPFIVHLPGYIIGNVAYKLLATPGEDEGIAQYKALGCGIGLGLYFSVFGGLIKRTMVSFFTRDSDLVTRFIVEGGCVKTTPTSSSYINTFLNTLALLIPPKLKVLNDSWWGRTLSLIGFGWFLVKWHGILVKNNHSRYQRMIARFQILAGLVLKPGLSMAEADSQGYTRLPPPPTNEFIRSKKVGEEAPPPPPAPISPRNLVLQLLAQKQCATVELGRFLRARQAEKDGKAEADWLRKRGAMVPDI